MKIVIDTTTKKVHARHQRADDALTPGELEFEVVKALSVLLASRASRVKGGKEKQSDYILQVANGAHSLIGKLPDKAHLTMMEIFGEDNG